MSRDCITPRFRNYFDSIVQNYDDSAETMNRVKDLMKKMGSDYDKLTRTNELSDSSFSSKRSYTEPVSEIEIKEFDESNSVSNTRLEAIADKLIDIDSGRVNTPSLTDFESRVFDLKEKEINNILNSRKKQTPVKSVSKKEVTSREEISSEIGYDPLDLKTNTVLSNKATGSKLKIVRFEKTKSGRYNFFLSKMDSNGYNYGIPVIKDQDDITFWRNQEVLPDMSFKDKQNQKVEKGIAVSEKTRVRNNPQVEYSWEKADSENVRVGSIVKYDGETYRITDSKAGKFKLKQSDDSGEIIPNGNNVADVIAKDIDQVRGKFSKITNNFEYTVDDIADDIYDAFFAFQESDKSLGLEQARAIAVVYDALAKKLSKREGISPAAWWEKHLQSIRFSRFEDFVKDYKKGALTQKQTNIALQYVDDQIEIYNKVIADPYTDERVIPELEAKVSELEKIRSKIENNDVSEELFQTVLSIGEDETPKAEAPNNKVMFQGFTVIPINADVVNGFYSPIEKTINETKFDKLPAKQWIDKFATGDEAKWTGLNDWLKQQQGSVSKADIQQYLKDNRIQVFEVVKGQEYPLTKEQIAERDFGVQYSELSESDKQSIENRYQQQGTETKFSQYQIEGEKSNYKEVLVTMPTENKLPEGWTVRVRDNITEGTKDRPYGVYDPEGKMQYTAPTEARAKALLREYEKTEPTKFQSPHFDEPNILVHLRMNTRTDADGKKVLFLEEVQSDWGQKGKKEGFDSKEKDAEFNKLKNNVESTANYLYEIENKLDEEYTKKRKDHNESRAELRKRDSDFNKLAMQYHPAEQAAFEARRAYDMFQVENRGVVPEAPFVTDTNAWTKLGLKVALKEAVKQGEQMQRTAFEKLVDEKMDWVEARMKKLGKLEVKCP